MNHTPPPATEPMRESAGPESPTPARPVAATALPPVAGSRTTVLGLASALVLLAALGLTADIWLLRLATEILLVGTAVMGLNLVVGQAGLVSLCHAALFGGAAYASALLALHHGDNLLLVLLTGIITGAVLALIAGLVSLRLQGLYFLVVTLITGQLLWEVVFHWRELTGGADGLRGFLADEPASRPWAQPQWLFALAAGWALVSWIFLRHLIRRPAGLLMQAMRDQPLRLQATGHSIARIRLAAFVASGIVAGGAGALYPFINHFLSPEITHWSHSASFLIMAVIGGIRSLAGAFLGAAVYLLCQTWLSSVTERWQLVVGLIFVAVVIFMPRGVASLFGRRQEP